MLSVVFLDLQEFCRVFHYFYLAEFFNITAKQDMRNRPDPDIYILVSFAFNWSSNSHIFMQVSVQSGEWNHSPTPQAPQMNTPYLEFGVQLAAIGSFLKRPAGFSYTINRWKLCLCPPGQRLKLSLWNLSQSRSGKMSHGFCKMLMWLVQSPETGRGESKWGGGWWDRVFQFKKWHQMTTSSF